MSMIKGPNGGLISSPQKGSQDGMHQTMRETGSCNGMVQGPNGGWVNSPPKK
jgi:hypothetical protein